MPESVERFAHPVNTTQSLQHVEEPQSHSTFPNRLKAPSLTNHNSGFSISTVRLQPVPGIEDRNHSERLARQGPSTHRPVDMQFMACSVARSQLLLQLRKSRVVGRGGRGRSVGRVTVPGLTYGVCAQNALRSVYLHQQLSFVRPLPFSFASFPSKSHTSSTGQGSDRLLGVVHGFASR
ncbi:hypothetical protein SMAC4_13114 [Sordaria macrospora]|uniref:uncharacterized protein n=1 Tax=Sordaria macrospora TaxID=5147 RepID=UPI002B29D0B2|nr:hypothetical protein SMAC4_13114 [Sordaria macrospora]